MLSDHDLYLEDPKVTLELLNDPEISKAATDPEGMAVIQDAPWFCGASGPLWA